jgi:predicted RecA/RadA family phage recombinase
MGKYNVNEGNQIGYMPTEFDTNGNLVEQKLVADGDLTAGQVVYISGNMKVKATTAASAAVLGVAMFDAKDGEPVAVECEGLFKLTAAGAISAGDLVESAAGGKVATVGETVTKTIGIALNAATADGDPVFVKFSI